MGLFSRNKQQPIQPTGFTQFLENDKKFFWVADYIDDRNEINEDAAFADMQEDSEIGAFTMPKFKKLVARLYAKYLEAEEEVASEDLELIKLIHTTPLNITIRRIKAKASGNNWSICYLGRTTYYGKTLNEAYRTLIKRNPNIEKKFGSVEA